MSPHDDELQARGYDHGLMRRLLGYLRPYRGRVALAIAVVLADSALQLVGPYLTKEAIDHGIANHDLGHLDLVATTYLSVLAAGFGLAYLHAQIMQRVGQSIMFDLRQSLFRHLQRLPIAFYDRNPVGRLMTRITNDVDTLNELFTAGTVAAIGDAATAIGVVFAMVRLNAELLAVAFSVLPLIVVVTLVFRALVRQSFRDIRTRLARMNAFFNENVSGVGTIQLLNREARNAGGFRSLNGAHRDANLKSVFYYALFLPAGDVVGALAVALIIWYGGRQVGVMQGAHAITLGTLVAFIQYTQRFFRPISDLSEKYNTLQQAMASSERVFGLLDTPVDPSWAAAPAPAAAVNGAAHDAEPARPSLARAVGEPAHASGRIEFEHVWFAYQGEHWVLEDVSFRVEPGERVALVGATGSGKSTVIALLLRLYEPQRGTIRVDGIPLAEWDARALRRRISVVLQDVFLFSGTIAGNLALGDDTLSRERLEQAAREVYADEFVRALPGSYDAPVVERGATLSAGQRQLLSFARALARDPGLLVLDEATSAVDTHTEQLIQSALERLMHGRTCLVVAHRLSTVQDVDRIVVLHHGQVRESGSHAELLAVGGIYARLHELTVLGGSTPRRTATLPEPVPVGAPPAADLTNG